MNPKPHCMYEYTNGEEKKKKREEKKKPKNSYFVCLSVCLYVLLLLRFQSTCYVFQREGKTITK
jgi:hypothetical protein